MAATQPCAAGKPPVGLERVHAPDAIVGVLALATGQLAAMQFVDKLSVVYQSACHLQGHEARIEHFLHFFS